MATPIPDNRASFSLGEIGQITGGVVRGDPALRLEGVSTDSRRDRPGALFVALRGDRFDGHAFAASAVASGAAAVLVSDGQALPDAPAVIVENTLEALGALGRAHRRRWAGTVVAVAGSAGKTTTRSCIAASLEVPFPGAVHESLGNLNNRVGVPMVLLGLDARHRVAVIEVGTNVRGEVSAIASVVEPDVGVLTLIDIEHAEGIGDIDAIAAEEGDLLAALRTDGAALGNADDERVVEQLRRARAARRVTYGTSARADYRVTERTPVGLRGARLSIERPAGGSRQTVVLECPLVGLPGALAAAASLAAADLVAGTPTDPGRVSEALARHGVGEAGRLVPIELADGTVVIDDTYNANPASVIAAMRVGAEIAATRGARLGLVLGEMRELGAASAEHHRIVGRAVGDVGAAFVVAIAGDARAYVEQAASVGVDTAFASDANAAVPLVLERVLPSDVVVVKASRGVRAERVVEALVQRGGRAS